MMGKRWRRQPGDVSEAAVLHRENERLNAGWSLLRNEAVGEDMIWEEGLRGRSAGAAQGPSEE